MSRFKALDLVVDTKPDLTPVSDADKSTEESIRSILSRARPRDAVTGEEFGSTGHGPRRWVLDPIDGTKNFIRGVPVWATLIALMDGDDVVAGLVSAPALGRRWWAGTGSGAWTGKSLSAASRMARVGRDPARRRVAVVLQPLRLARPRPGGRLPRADPRRAGGPGPSATSGPTCWWPRAPSTWPPSRRWRSTTWLPRRSSSPRPAAGSPTSTAPTGPAGGSAIATNGHLHDEVVRRLTP